MLAGANIPASRDVVDFYLASNGQEYYGFDDSTAFMRGHVIMDLSQAIREYEVNVECMRDPEMFPLMGRDADHYCVHLNKYPSPVYTYLKEFDPEPAFDNLLSMSQTLLNLYESRVDNIAEAHRVYKLFNPSGELRAVSLSGIFFVPEIKIPNFSDIFGSR